MTIEIVGPPSKGCTTCGLSKCISGFSKTKRGKYGVRSICKECRKLVETQRRKNSEKYKRSSKLYYLRTKDKQNARQRGRRSQRQEYYLRTRDKRIAAGLAFAKENPAIYAARAMCRLIQVRQATPSWSCKEKILEKYKLAAKNTAETRIKWHVDHIVPLVSHFVCGLHVAANLEVILASENIAKGNRYWPDMP